MKLLFVVTFFLVLCGSLHWSMCRCGDSFNSLCYCQRWLGRRGVSSDICYRHVLHWTSTSSVLGLWSIYQQLPWHWRGLVWQVGTVDHFHHVVPRAVCCFYRVFDLGRRQSGSALSKCQPHDWGHILWTPRSLCSVRCPVHVADCLATWPAFLVLCFCWGSLCITAGSIISWLGRCSWRRWVPPSRLPCALGRAARGNWSLLFLLLWALRFSEYLQFHARPQTILIRE